MIRNLGRAVLWLGIPTVATWFVVDGTLPTWIRMAGMVTVGAAVNAAWTMREHDGAHREMDEREQDLDAWEQVLELREGRVAPVRDLTGDWPEPLRPRVHELPATNVPTAMPWSGEFWDQAVATYSPTWGAAEDRALARVLEEADASHVDEFDCRDREYPLWSPRGLWNAFDRLVSRERFDRLAAWLGRHEKHYNTFPPVGGRHRAEDDDSTDESWTVDSGQLEQVVTDETARHRREFDREVATVIAATVHMAGVR